MKCTVLQQHTNSKPYIYADCWNDNRTHQLDSSAIFPFVNFVSSRVEWLLSSWLCFLQLLVRTLWTSQQLCECGWDVNYYEYVYESIESYMNNKIIHIHIFLSNFTHTYTKPAKSTWIRRLLGIVEFNQNQKWWTVHERKCILEHLFIQNIFYNLTEYSLSITRQASVFWWTLCALRRERECVRI